MLDTVRSCGCDDTSVLAGLMSISDARNRALSLVSPLIGGETLALAQALGRILSCAVSAPAAMPFFSNSAMDGFAVQSTDFAGDGPWVLPEAGTVSAGRARGGTLTAGQVARIFTGAPIPENCDSVVMVEKTRETPEGILFHNRPRPGDNIRLQGSDLAQGQNLVKAGTRLAPHHIGLLAANGIETVSVVRRPRVAVFSTGDEITETGRGAGQIFDANRPMLIALANAMGADVQDCGILPDDLDNSARRLAEIAGDVDMILTSGAVSMGGRDFLRPALEAAGGTIDAWRVAMKPGKPVMFGALSGCIVTGLPGNPMAALIGFHVFVQPQLRKMCGQPARTFAAYSATAGFSWKRKPGRDEVFPVRLSGNTLTGQPELQRLGQGVSATLLPVADADGLAIIPGQTVEVSPGDPLMWQPFSKEI